MTVYVDNMRRLATIGSITGRWSHLIADTDDELHTFATAIGLPQHNAQFPGTWKSHYDLTDSKRAEAIAAGAVEIGYTSAQAVALLRHKRQTHPPQPQLRLQFDVLAQPSSIEGGQ